jgi:hypothetical protein
VSSSKTSSGKAIKPLRVCDRDDRIVGAQQWAGIVDR